MKCKRLIITGCALVLAAFTGIFILNNFRRRPFEQIEAAQILSYLEDGDIICRMGDRIWSLYFRDISLTDKRFSHLGIVRIRDGNISIINAEGGAAGRRDSVNEVTLQEFIEIARAIGVYRANFINGSIISDSAFKYKGRPFDWKFDLTERDNIYCTELLYIILKDIAPDIVLKTMMIEEAGRTIVPLDACSNSTDFTEMLYITTGN
jgi:hypothetical protein